jgi:glutamyl-tRNA synthetase
VARRLNAPIIQWVMDGEHVSATLLVPHGVDLKEEPILVEKRILEEKVDSIVQLYRIGFARVDSNIPGKLVLIYAHD